MISVRIGVSPASQNGAACPMRVRYVALNPSYRADTSSDLSSRRFVGMTGIERRRRVIFYAELNFSGHRLPRDFSNDTKPKIDPCGHTTPSNHVAIFHDSRLFMCGSDEGQKISKRPMRRGPASLQQTGYT